MKISSYVALTTSSASAAVSTSTLTSTAAAGAAAGQAAGAELSMRSGCAAKYATESY